MSKVKIKSQKHVRTGYESHTDFYNIMVEFFSFK